MSRSKSRSNKDNAIEKIAKKKNIKSANFFFCASFMRSITFCSNIVIQDRPFGTGSPMLCKHTEIHTNGRVSENMDFEAINLGT